MSSYLEIHWRDRCLAVEQERDALRARLAEATPIIAAVASGDELLQSWSFMAEVWKCNGCGLPINESHTVKCLITQARAYQAKYASDAPVPVGVEDFAIGAVNEPHCDECGEFLSECECEPEWDIPQDDATDTERR